VRFWDEEEGGSTSRGERGGEVGRECRQEGGEGEGGDQIEDEAVVANGGENPD